MGRTASHTPHLAEAPLHCCLRGLLLALARAEKPHGAQEADQEAPVAAHRRSCLAACRCAPWRTLHSGAGRESADEARAGRPPPAPHLRAASQARPRLSQPLSSRHRPGEPADVPRRPNRPPRPLESASFPAREADEPTRFPVPPARPLRAPPAPERREPGDQARLARPQPRAGVEVLLAPKARAIAERVCLPAGPRPTARTPAANPSVSHRTNYVSPVS